jgi:hypothetical protein
MLKLNIKTRSFQKIIDQQQNRNEREIAVDFRINLTIMSLVKIVNDGLE